MLTSGVVVEVGGSGGGNGVLWLVVGCVVVVVVVVDWSCRRPCWKIATLSVVAGKLRRC